MLLMPDPNTANIDPFFEEPTLILTCDVVEPGDGKPYERDPRSLAKRAEAYLKASGLGDTAYFGPEPEFFIFDSVRWQRRHVGLLRQDRVRRGGLEHRQGIRARQLRATARRSRAATSRCRRSTACQDMRSEMCLILESLGIPVEVHHHEVAQRRPDGDRHQVQHAGAARRLAAAAEVRDPERRPRLRQDRDLHAQADRRRQRLRHARAPVGLEGRQEPVRRRRLRRPVGVRAVLHRRHHQARPRAERDHQPRHQQLQAPGARLRGAGEAGLLGARTARRRSASRTCANPKGRRIEVRFPDPTVQPVPRLQRRC